jgi:Flp pilus assembly pilin Flp
MRKFLITWFRIRLWREERGQDMVEYALLAGLAAVASGLFVPDMSASMGQIYSRVASKLVQASS